MRGQLQQFRQLLENQTGTTPRRLRPVVEGTGWAFGFALKRLGVPVEPRKNDGTSLDVGETGAVYAVPKCCAELYFARLDSKNALSKLSIETVAKLAADVYFEEAKAS